MRDVSAREEIRVGLLRTYPRMSLWKPASPLVPRTRRAQTVLVLRIID